MGSIVGLTFLKVIGAAAVCPLSALRLVVLNWWVGRADLCRWSTKI